MGEQLRNDHLLRDRQSLEDDGEGGTSVETREGIEDEALLTKCGKVYKGHIMLPCPNCKPKEEKK